MLLFVFIRLFLESFEYSARIKSLFRQKLFLKRSKKIKDCRLSDEFSQARSFFVFLLKKSFDVCSFVTFSDVP